MNKTTLQNQYNSLIEEYQALKLDKEVNFDLTLERHHILPKALGGGDEGGNIVILPAQQHFKAHELLSKIHGGPMWYAFWWMCNTMRSKGVDINAEEYQIARKEFTSMLIGNQYAKGYKHTPETRAKISLANKGSNNHNFGKFGANNSVFGYKHTPENKAKISIANKGLKRSPDTIAKIVKARTGKKHKPESIEVMRKNNAGTGNPRYDHVIYTFKHKDGRTFTGTRYDFKREFNLNQGNLCNVVNGKNKTIKGWYLVEIYNKLHK